MVDQTRLFDHSELSEIFRSDKAGILRLVFVRETVVFRTALMGRDDFTMSPSRKRIFGSYATSVRAARGRLANRSDEYYAFRNASFPVRRGGIVQGWISAGEKPGR